MMKKDELQKYTNYVKLLHDYAKSDGQLQDLNKDEIKALQVAVNVMQEKCDSLD